MVNLNYYTYVKYVRIMAEQAGLSLEFTKEKQPRCTKDTIYVQQPDANWTDDQFNEWLYTLYHEIGHLTPICNKSWDIYVKYKLKTGTLAHSMMNILDDTSQEQLQIEEGYSGRNNTLFSEGHKWKSNSIEHIGKHAGDIRQALESFFVWDMTLRDSKYNLAHVIDKCKDKLLPKSKAWLEILEKKYTSKYKELDFYNNPDVWEKMYQMIKDILDNVFKIPPEQSGIDGEDTGEGKEREEGKEGEDKDKGKKGIGKKGDSTNASGKQVDAVVNFDDLLFHKHSEKKPSYNSLTINYSKIPDRDNYLCSDVTIKSTHDTRVYNSYKSEFNNVPDSSLASALRRILLAKSRTIHQYGMRKGKLHKKNIFKATLKDSGNYQERIFKKKIDNTTLNKAIYILGDISGSMGGKKVVSMAHSMILLNDALKSLRVPFEMTTFTHDYDGALHTIIKPFDKILNKETIVNNLCVAANDMMNNADGESILWAYSKLKMRPEAKKILIVLSDGQPACNNPSIVGFTKQVISQVEQEGIVDIYGIGIQTPHVEKFYKRNTVISKASDLEHKLLEIVKNTIIN